MPQVSPDHLHHMDTSSATKVELSPLRNIIRVDRCRGCEACVDVCSFDAIRMELNDAGGQVARIEPALCRGCKLCSGVCPTHAAVSVAYDEPWWQSQLAAVGSWRDTESPVKDSLVVLACQRRTGSIAETYTQNGRRVQIVRLRCVGELVAGQILSVLGAGASKVLVAGCSSDRCRFDEGSTLADDQIRLAKASLNEFGLDPDRIEASWSSGRAFDRLELLLGTARSGSRTVGVGSDTPRNGGRHG